MRQIFLDTETTGLEHKHGHRIIEIGGVEMRSRRQTNRHFHRYLNPDRDIDEGAQAVHGISLWIHNWKRNGWRTADKKPVKNAELWQRLDELAKTHDLKWLWVKGHAGHPGNERADALANRGIDELLAAR